MRRLVFVPFVASVLLLMSGGTVSAEQARGNASSSLWSGAFLQSSHTPTQKAVYAPYVAVWPARNFDTALSISNTLSGPPGIQEVFDAFFGDLEGTIEIYLFSHTGDGTPYFYETGPGSPGRGLSEDGTLTPGKSYLVLLSQILAEVGYDFEANDGIFAGYAWIVANFDGVQGTANPTDFALFTQTTTMQPDLGGPGFDFSADAGIPISPPEEDGSN